MDLETFALIFENTEKIVRKANRRGIVFPDLATEANILIDEEEGYKINIIDYNGFQVKNNPSPFISTQIKGSTDYYFRSNKYGRWDSNGLFVWTENVDKLTLISQFLYGLTGLNITEQPKIENRVEEFLDFIGLDDEEIRAKIKLLFDDSKKKVYFEDSYKKIAQIYDLQPISVETSMVDENTLLVVPPIKGRGIMMKLVRK